MSPGRNLPLRSAFAAVGLICALGAPARGANSDWQIVKVGKWDYLTVDNIAKFYGFPGPVTPVEKVIRLDNGRNSLELMLDSREAIVNGVRNWLCFPVIAHTDGKYLVSRIDLAKTLEPQLRPHMISNLGRFRTVVIDPGHGGTEKGAASSYGLEKNFALDVALKLKPLLEAKGLRVVMTRTSDEHVPLPQRARIANSTRDSIFVSIHFNATDYNPHATGFEIYSLTPRGAPSTQDNALLQRFVNMQAGSPVDAASLALSMSVYHAMLGHLPEFDRGIKRARFAVLRLTQVPAILVEGGFLTERNDSRDIAKPEWRAKLAHAISVGIDNYRALVEKKQRPMLLADYRRAFEGVLVARNANAPGATPPEFVPASNSQLVGETAQVTAALRREPSAQLSVNAPEPEEHEGEESEAHGAPVAAEPLETASATIEVPAETPPAEPAADEIPSAATESAPPPAEPQPQPATVEALVTPPATIESGQDAPPAPPPPAPTASPAPVVRKYWILKFEPPPKFRQ